MTTPANNPHLSQLFELVAAGQLTAQAATELSAASAMVSIDGATIDLGRAARCGFGEVVYGEGKSAELIVAITSELLEQQAEVLVTRCDAVIAQQVGPRFGGQRYVEIARTLRLSHSPLEAARAARATPPLRGRVAVVCAGSTDLPVAREAAETLHWMGVEVLTMDDIGVAGPQRLLAHVESLRRADAIVVVAGMEGALPSVVAGHVAAPVIAVPTSVGYGAALGGLTALLGMLSSCAANVSVVNIDAGFKGGYVAGLIAQRCTAAGDASRSSPGA